MVNASAAKILLVAAIAVVLTPLMLLGRSAFEENHFEAVQDNPPGVRFTIAFAEPRSEYRIGEVIQLELHFASDLRDTYRLDAATYDRSGRLNLDTYHIDPVEGASDPLGDYFGAGVVGMIGGGIRQTPVLESKPYSLTFALNEWLRFDRAGDHRLFVTTKRVKWVGGGDKTVASNLVKLRILPRDSAFESVSLANAVRQFEQPPPVARSVDPHIAGTASTEQFEAPRRAARILRFLGTKAAVDAMIQRRGRYGGNVDWEFKAGLIGSPQRRYVQERMKELLDHPEAPIDAGLLHLMALLSYVEEFPQPRPTISPEKDYSEEAIERFRADARERGEAFGELLRSYASALSKALPSKSQDAQLVAYNTLRQMAPELAVQHRHVVEVPTPTPSTFLGLTSQEQSDWLWDEEKWKRIAGPGMVPVLVDLIDNTSADDSDWKRLAKNNLQRHKALVRLYELEPNQARRLLILEIQRPGAIIVDSDLLAILPPGPFPEVDEALAKNLEGEHTFTAASLLRRFGSPAIYERVKSVYRERAGRWNCATQADLLVYLVRANPSDAVPLVDQALEMRAYTACHRTVLSSVAGPSLGPSLQALVTARLTDPDGETAADAARVLRYHGSEIAREPLWRRLESWYEEWKGRKRELRPHPITGLYPHRGQAKLEEALREALCCAIGWMVTDEELDRLAELCVADCMGPPRHWEDDGRVRLRVTWLPGADSPWSFQIGRYNVGSIEDAKKKIAQLPKGTVFLWDTRAHVAAFGLSKIVQARREIESFLGELQMKIEDE
jgi:hypothetical protein